MWVDRKNPDPKAAAERADLALHALTDKLAAHFQKLECAERINKNVIARAALAKIVDFMVGDA